MARFYVGQRVKLVRPFYLHNFGKTGVIKVILPEEVDCLEGGKVNCEVEWDDGEQGDPTWRWMNHTNQLEPLCKDDDEVGSWDALRDLGLDVDLIKEAVYV
jgi:hypothetical protein